MLKKIIISIIFAVFCGALCGCSARLPFSKDEIPEFACEQEFSAEISCGKLKAEARVSRSEAGRKFEFTAPGSLCGMTFTISESSLCGELDGLEFSVGENEDYAALPEIIAAALDAANGVSEEKITLREGIYTVETEFCGKTVTIEADKTGKILSIKSPAYNLSALIKY